MNTDAILKSLCDSLVRGQYASFDGASVPAECVRKAVLGIDVGEAIGTLRNISQGTLRIRGARIAGRLMLEGITAPGGGSLPALVFEDCTLEGGISVANSHFLGLQLINCRWASPDASLPTVDASSAAIAGDVRITNCQAESPQDIAWFSAHNAIIDGDLSLFASKFRSPPPREALTLNEDPRYAILLKGTEIKGRIACYGGVEAHGGIIIMDVHVHGDAWFSGTYASAGEGMAFRGQSARIHGNLSFMTLSEDGLCFCADGQVDLGGAMVAGDLCLTDLRIRRVDGWAVNLGGANIGKSLLLGRQNHWDGSRPRILGAVWMQNCRVGVDLRLAGLAIGVNQDLALIADGATIGGRLIIEDYWPLSRGCAADEHKKAFLSSAALKEDGVNRPFGSDIRDRYLRNDISINEVKAGSCVIGTTCAISANITARGSRFEGDVSISGTLAGELDISGTTIANGSLKVDGLTFLSEGSIFRLVDTDIAKAIETRSGGRAAGPALRIRVVHPRCLPNYTLVEALWAGAVPRMSGYLVRNTTAGGSGWRRQNDSSSNQVQQLDGQSPVFHELHKAGELQIDGIDAARDLLQLFCNYLQGADGAFRLIGPNDALPLGTAFDREAIRKSLSEVDEEIAELQGKADAGDADAGKLLAMVAERQTFLRAMDQPELDDANLGEVIRSHLQAPTITEEDGIYLANADVLYGDGIFRTVLKIDPVWRADQRQLVEMLEDLLLTSDLKVPVRFAGRVVAGHGPDGWPMGPALPGMRELEGQELQRYQEIVQKHHPDIAEFNRTTIDLTDAQCDTLRDGGGRDWGDGVKLILSRFTYRHADTYRQQSLPIARWKIGPRIRAWLRDSSHEAISARRRWLMQSYRRPAEGVPSARELRRDFDPQPFEQLIQVARASGDEAMATAIEIDKAWIVGGQFTARHRPWLFVVGCVFAAAWALLHGLGDAMDVGILCLILAGITYLFDIGNLSVWAMFGYLRRPVRAVVALAAWITIGSFGVMSANANGRLVIDVTPAATGLESTNGRFATPVIEGRSVEAIACGDEINETLYAADVFIPLIDLRQEARCTVGVAGNIGTAQAGTATAAHPAGWTERQIEGFLARTVYSRTFWEIMKASYGIIGWLVLSLAILTFARIDRRSAEP